MTTTSTKPDDAIMLALLGDTDLRERTAAMTAEVERVAAETRDLRLRAHAMLLECAELESAANDRLEVVVDQCAATITPKVDLREGVVNLVAALTGSDALHLTMCRLGEKWQSAAEDANYTDDEQEVAAE
jgi:uncharacterized small protein (DUF1192 family)